MHVQKSASKKRPKPSQEDYFYPEENMPCILDSPYCSYDTYSFDDADEAKAGSKRRKTLQQGMYLILFISVCSI